jgi:hypothetical protein
MIQYVDKRWPVRWAAATAGPSLRRSSPRQIRHSSEWHSGRRGVRSRYGFQNATIASSLEYIVLCRQVIGGNGRPFEIVYNFDGERFSERDGAIRPDFRIRGSDDFNIVIRGQKLVSLDWMQKPVDTDPAILAHVAESACLESEK